jgi:hypothetical protein
MRVALLVSGHLREVCRDERHTAPLLSVVEQCREVATCDVFLQTFDRLHAALPVAGEGDAGWPRRANRSNGVSVLPCVALLHKRLRLAAVQIEAQPRDVVPRYAGTAWFRRNTSSSATPLAAIRSAVHGAFAVGALKRRHCEVYGGGPYAVAVRLRPDLYPVKGKEWTSLSLPHTHAWPQIARAARRGLGPGGLAVNATIFACGSARLPGDKSADACFWGGDGVVWRVLRAWEGLVEPWLDSNLCWQRWRAQPEPRPPPNVSGCGAENECSRAWGCLAETALAKAIERVGATRGLTTR